MYQHLAHLPSHRRLIRTLNLLHSTRISKFFRSRAHTLRDSPLVTFRNSLTPSDKQRHATRGHCIEGDVRNIARWNCWNGARNNVQKQTSGDVDKLLKPVVRAGGLLEVDLRLGSERYLHRIHTPKDERPRHRRLEP